MFFLHVFMCFFTCFYVFFYMFFCVFFTCFYVFFYMFLCVFTFFYMFLCVFLHVFMCSNSFGISSLLLIEGLNILDQVVLYFTSWKVDTNFFYLIPGMGLPCFFYIKFKRFRTFFPLYNLYGFWPCFLQLTSCFFSLTCFSFVPVLT